MSGVRPNRDRSGDEGSSPLLDVDCPQCKAVVGKCCKKTNGARQIIAHKARSRAFVAAGYTIR
jgi:hypothetical protein